MLDLIVVRKGGTQPNCADTTIYLDDNLATQKYAENLTLDTINIQNINQDLGGTSTRRDPIKHFSLTYKNNYIDEDITKFLHLHGDGRKKV